jgi:PIN domain nuclease of toxin-antitoxin system
LRLLLDTNALVWWRDGSSRLSERVREQIGNPDNDVSVSITSLWEITIKQTLGKLHFLQDFEEVLAEESFDLLGITYRHLRALATLPLHHRDPFDRMLIAQSIVEGMALVSNERLFERYGVTRLW